MLFCHTLREVWDAILVWSDFLTQETIVKKKNTSTRVLCMYVCEFPKLKKSIIRSVKCLDLKLFKIGDLAVLTESIFILFASWEYITTWVRKIPKVVVVMETGAHCLRYVRSDRTFLNQISIIFFALLVISS